MHHIEFVETFKTIEYLPEKHDCIVFREILFGFEIMFEVDAVTVFHDNKDADRRLKHLQTSDYILIFVILEDEYFSFDKFIDLFIRI